MAKNVIQEKHLADNTYKQKLTAHFMAYLHVGMGAPVLNTYIKAIKNNWLSTFPGLTIKVVQLNLPKTLQTVIGHQQRPKQNIRSTKNIVTTMMMNETKYEMTLEPPCQVLHKKYNVGIIPKMFEKIQGMISTNQTGWFLIISE